MDINRCVLLFGLSSQTCAIVSYVRQSSLFSSRVENGIRSFSWMPSKTSHSLHVKLYIFIIYYTHIYMYNGERLRVLEAPNEQE